jgi:hypothetical protein
MGWALMVVGAGFLFAPGMIDPLAPITGASLIGLGLVAWAAVKLIGETK